MPHRLSDEELDELLREWAAARHRRARRWMHAWSVLTAMLVVDIWVVVGLILWRDVGAEGALAIMLLWVLTVESSREYRHWAVTTVAADRLRR